MTVKLKKRVVKIQKDKRGRFIRHRKKKIYMKGSLDSIKRYIKNLFAKEAKERDTYKVIQNQAYPTQTYIPDAVKREEIAVPSGSDSNLVGELLQKSKADMVNIAKSLGLKNISALTKTLLAEQIISAGWAPKGDSIPKSPVVRGRRAQKPELIQKITELTGSPPKANLSVAQLQSILENAMKVVPDKFELVERPVRQPSPPLEELKTEKPTGIISSIKSAFQNPDLFKLKKTYPPIPFYENRRYLTLLTGIKNPSEEEIFQARAKSIKIDSEGNVLYNMPQTLNKTQASALVKILGIDNANSFTKEELIDLMKSRLDSGVLDFENSQITAEAKGDIVDVPEQVDLEDQTGSGKDEGISNEKIDKIMKNSPLYLGTIGHDQILSQILPKVKEKSKGGFIINTDPINKKGVHWQSVYFDATNNGEYEIDFFDSYGDDPDERVMKDLKQLSEKLNCKLLLKFKSNRIALQNERSSNCGWFCIKFLNDRFRGKPFADASGFSDVVRGEKEIRKFKEQHGGFIQYLPSLGRFLPDSVKKFLFFPPNKLSGTSQKVFDKVKGYTVTKLMVNRVPIHPAISKALDILSLGTFSKKMKELNYDQMFHLSLVLYTNNGKISIQKNERVDISFGGSGGGESIDIPYDRADTVGSFFAKALNQMGDHKFFQYSPFSNNCQAFVAGLLKANGALSEEAKKFVLQPADEILKAMPRYVGRIAQFLTDSAGKFSQIFTGQG